jgi:hypothetical protein
MRALRRVSSICEPSTRRPCVGKQALSAVSTTWKWRARAETAGTTVNVGNLACPAARRHTRGGRSPKIHGARGVIPMMREFDSNERVAPVNGEALALRQAKARCRVSDCSHAKRSARRSGRGGGDVCRVRGGE